METRLECSMHHVTFEDDISLKASRMPRGCSERPNGSVGPQPW